MTLKKLSRRSVLRGLGGVSLALPVFESMMGSKAFAAEPRDRFFFAMKAGNGVLQANNETSERFWPEATGALTTAGLKTPGNAARATGELADFASRLLMVKNVSLPFSYKQCAHSEAIVQLLTAQNFTPGVGSENKALGRSVDWYIAEKVNPKGVQPLAFIARGSYAYIEEAMSWSSAQTKTPAERKPLAAYMRMTGLSTAPVETQRLIALRRKSVNDLVRGDLTTLKSSSQLSSFDKQRLDQHLTAVRDLEMSMTCDLDPAQVNAVKGIADPESNDARPEVVKRFLDLTAWAFNCRLNRVGTLQVGSGNDSTQYYYNGSKLPSFHWISHRISADGSEGEPIPNALELHHQVDRIQLQFFRHFLQRLDSYASPYGGTLLDDSLALWCNDVGTGAHSSDNLPFIFAGKAGGNIQTGKFIDHQKKGVNQVLNSIINAVGIRQASGALVDDFGDAKLAKGNVAGMLV